MHCFSGRREQRHLVETPFSFFVQIIPSGQFQGVKEQSEQSASAKKIYSRYLSPRRTPSRQHDQKGRGNSINFFFTKKVSRLSSPKKWPRASSLCVIFVAQHVTFFPLRRKLRRRKRRKKNSKKERLS